MIQIAYKNHSLKSDCNHKFQIKIKHDLWFDCSQFQSQSLASNMFFGIKIFNRLYIYCLYCQKGEIIWPNLSISKLLFEEIQ